MDVTVSADSIATHTTEVLIVGLYRQAELEGVAQAIDKALGGAISDLLASGDFSGKTKQVAVLYPRAALPAQRVLLVGLGNSDDYGPETARRAAATAVRKAQTLKAQHLTIVLAGGPTVGDDARAMAEGCSLAAYHYQGQRNKPADPMPETLTLLVASEDERAAAAQGAATGQAIAAGVQVTRDLVNLPPNICTPAYMARIAAKVAQAAALKIEVLEREQMAALEMGALLAVARGSETPPRFIVLEHNAARAAELDTLVLVGKGVTFDTGGYSIKSQSGMNTMKGDMAGAAAVIGAMRVIGTLDVPLHVVGLAPTADNMISGKAYRPQEVITASNGVTIEINSTDAEGRMLLADALVYAGRYTPAAVVDIATLTGACMVALGAQAAGLFGTDDRLRDLLRAAGDANQERVWPLPLYDEYKQAMESQTADIRNSSSNRMAGVGTSAIFLKHFVDYPVWAHLDMAGMESEAAYAKEIPYVPDKGASGYGVRLLAEFAQRWAAQDS